MTMYMTVKSPIVSIIVGPEGNEETFNAHQAPLEARSDVFKNAFKRDRFVEGHERVIRFPHEDPEVFRLYLSSADDPLEVKNYNRRIMNGDAPTDWNAFHEWFDPQATRLAQVFVLAHMLWDLDMMTALYSQMDMLAWASFKFDGRYQQAAFPITGVIAL